MDIVDHYLINEKDHIPLLIAFLKNKKGLNRGDIMSNLFNFKVNFDLDEVIVEDDAGLFCKSEGERELITSPEELLSRIQIDI